MPLKPSDGIGSYIKDFKKSKAPQFKGKSDEKKRDMAIAAYLDARRESNIPKFPARPGVSKAPVNKAGGMGKKLSATGVVPESTLAGNNIKLFGRADKKPTNELSMRKRWKAKVQRALVGPSDKAKPDIFRTTGKRAKAIAQRAKGHTALANRDDTRMQLAKRALNREDTSFKVTIDGLPDMYMDAKTPGALLQKLRKIVKQPSLIKDIDRTTKNKVKKAWRDRAQGREVEEATDKWYKNQPEWGTPESSESARKITPGQREDKDPRLARAGVAGFNKAKRTPNHSSKSHIVVAKDGSKVKTIRFGQKGAETAGAPKKGESDRMKAKRKSFKARHGKNIAKGKMSAAYWADKEKW